MLGTSLVKDECAPILARGRKHAPALQDHADIHDESQRLVDDGSDAVADLA